MIRLDLTGSTVANFAVGGGSHAVDVPRGGVVCTAARRMLTLGVDPDEEIDVRRDGKPAFAQIKTVGWWAARTVVEDSEHRGRGFRARAAYSSPDPDTATAQRQLSAPGIGLPRR